MVIWQQSIYPISSTVVAKGLCQQDRKKQQPLLPPAFWMATDFTKALWASGQWNGSKPCQPSQEGPEVKSVSTGQGGSCLHGLRVSYLWVPDD